MNKQIRELARQVDACYIPRYDMWQMDTESLKKFAELIVREMCSVLDKAQWDKGEDWVCADGTRIIPQIKEHFGVEE